MKYANPAWRERENENIPTSPTPTYDTDPLYGPTSKLDRDLNPPARPTANIAAQIAKLKVNMKPILNKLAFSSLSPNTDPEQLQCLKELAKDPSIHLGLSDKTNKIIAIDPVIVRKQTLKHLQNRSLFREVDRDPSEQIEKGGNDLLNSILPSLNRASKEGKKIYKRLYTYDTRAPIIQPLLKDHKPDFPNCNIRPVQPVTNSAVEKIDLTVSQVLTQITPLLPYRAKDTAAFKTRLRSLPRPPQGSFMVSLDIVNMYPSMPTDEKALEIIEDYLETYHDVINLFGFTTTNIVDLLRFVLHNTYISYNGRYFIQESGVGTGNHSSGAYSEILVDWTYQQAMMVAPNEPVGLTCYVDDAWMLWYGSLTEFQGFKDALNAIWPTVKFEEEMEENGMINFLDLTITRNEEDDSVTVGGGETAEELSSFFSSVFTNESFGPLEEHCYRKSENYSEISDFESSFDVLDVKKELSKVNPCKSMGPDGIHPKIIKSLANDSGFVEAAYRLFTTCAENRKIPSEWKLANVVPLHKKGSRDRSESYRPISLTCIMGKVYEKLVRKHMVDHVGNLIAPEQHGFLPGRSCTSNLLDSMDVILDMIDDGLPVDMLFFDFSKAFDTVPHHRLLVKLENYGITGGTLEIIQDFLADRWMRVGVGDHFSELTRVISGVPQGSILGPLLFLLYINDLPEAIKSKVFLFADDLKMIANPFDKEVVDDDLRSLEIWENTWLLKFNTAKCKVLHFDINSNPCNDYVLDGSKLEVVDVERDLGLLISKDLRWDEQVKGSLCKANQTIAWITRNVICKSKEVMKKIYICLIRPHLEYCVQLWSPVAAHGSWGTIYEIEKVQRKFTNLIDDIGTLQYGTRLAELNLTTLAERRIRGDLIETFKIVNNVVDYGHDIFTLGRSGRNIVSCGLKVSSFRKKFFSERVIQYWNVLPNFVKLSSSVNSFKANLSLHKSQQLKSEHYVSSVGNFWEVSERVLQRIESPSAVAGRDAFCEYLNDTPWVAKRKGINIFKNPL